jgi:hypothetical protein
MTVLLRPSRHWVCPNCKLEQVTHEARPHTRFHPCPGLKGLTAPMVEAGVHCEVVAVEREDYVGADRVQTDSEGHPWMAVVTKRDDGEDRAVLAPTATGRSAT